MRQVVAAKAAAVVVVALLVGACRPEIPESYIEWTTRHYDGVAANTLAIGDRFAISVAFHDDMNAEYSVPTSGAIDYHFIGQVPVEDRLCEEIAHEIRDRLANGYLSEPTVQCEVLEMSSRQVVVSGEVDAPGVQPYATNLTIIEAIAGAGGLTREAAKDRLLVSRQTEEGTVEILVPLQQILNGRAPTLPLWPGDSVFVPAYRIIP